jgi:hypothetical protein
MKRDQLIAAAVVGGIKIGSRPPAMAPLAFCGLGTLGALVCAARRE